MSEYLSSEKLPQLLFSHDRSFQPGEKHVTRVCPEDVLLLMFSGVLRFTEDGVPVEVRGGEYYIQKRGLSQQGQVPSDCPVYYYVHFLGHWSSEGGIRKRGPLPAEAQTLTCRLTEADQLGAPLLERTSLFYQPHPFVPQPPSNPCGTAGGKRPAAVAASFEGWCVPRPNRRRAARQRELSNPHFSPPVSDHAPPLPDASSSGTGSAADALLRPFAGGHFAGMRVPQLRQLLQSLLRRKGRKSRRRAEAAAINLFPQSCWALPYFSQRKRPQPFSGAAFRRSAQFIPALSGNPCRCGLLPVPRAGRSPTPRSAGRPAPRPYGRPPPQGLPPCPAAFRCRPPVRP